MHVHYDSGFIMTNATCGIRIGFLSFSLKTLLTKSNFQTSQSGRRRRRAERKVGFIRKHQERELRLLRSVELQQFVMPPTPLVQFHTDLLVYIFILSV